MFSTATPEFTDLSRALSELWRETVTRWFEAEAHEAFIKTALASGELAAAGRLYRIALARSPGDQRAILGRDEVVRLALSPALPSKESSAKDHERRKLIVTVAAVGVVLSLLGGLAALVL